MSTRRGRSDRRPVDPRLVRTAPAARGLLVGLVVAQSVGAVLTVVQLGLLAEVLADVVLRHATVASVGARLIGLATCLAARAFVAGGQEWLAGRASVRVRADVRRAVLRAVVRLGPGWAARQSTGRLVTAAGPGLEGVDGYLTRALPALVASCVVPPLVLARIGWSDWSSLLLLLVALPLVPLFMVLVGIGTRRRMERQYATLARLSGHFLDLVQGLTTLRVYGRADAQAVAVRRSTETYRTHTMATLRTAFLSGLVLDLIATLSVAVVAVAVGLRVAGGDLGLTAGLTVLLLAPEVFAPLRAVGAQYHASEEGRVALAAAFDIVAEAAEAAVLPGSPARAGTPARGPIGLAGVTATYPGRTLPALDGVTARIEPGTFVALTGDNGSGKSTLLAVLLGHVTPASGGLRLTGPDREVLAGDSWRRDVAWVPQRPRSSQATAADEVRLGDPGATDADIAGVIARCHAPAGSTALGEAGTLISAGQRRRLALARALLRAHAVIGRGGCPLVLLDEPTEDLDPLTEHVVLEVIEGLAGHATVVAASHDVRLVARATREIALHDGQIWADVTREPSQDATEVPPPPAEPLHAAAVRPTEPSGRRMGVADILAAGRATWVRLLAAAATGGLGGLTGLALTACSLWLICRAGQQPNVQALALAVVGVRTFALSRALLRYGERLLAHDGALRLLSDVRVRVFRALIPLVPVGVPGVRRGDLLRRFTTDVDGAQEALVRAAVPAFSAAVTAVGATALAMALAPSAGAALAVGLILAGVVVPLLAARAAGDGRALGAASAHRDERTVATLESLAELDAYGAADDAVAEVVAADRAVAAAARRPVAAGALTTTLGGLVTAVTWPAVIGFGTAAVRSGQTGPVEIGVLAACVLAGFDAVTGLPVALAAWSRCRAGLERVAGVLGAGAASVEPVVGAPPPAGELGLRARGLGLAPGAGAPAVLTDARLDLAPGRRVAVAGPSGCGKSTLLASALRLLTPTAGEWTLRSVDGVVRLTDVASLELPAHVAGSLQGDHVFNASLRDNVRVVKPDATDAELDAVADRIGLGALVRGLPEGWSTVAGADGASLSGGQRQRVLLARALLADPDVLVLDEPTAHLDAATERAVLDDLLDGTAGRTVLLSSHRALDGRVDTVLRFAGGRLTGSTAVQPRTRRDEPQH